MVTLSYGYANAFFEDCDDTAGWSKTEDGNTAAIEVENGDYFKITISGSTGNKIAYYTNNFTDFSSDTYQKIRFRYKTSDTNIKAKILVRFDDATEHVVLDETSSTTFTVGAVDIVPPASTTIDRVRIYANQATGWVKYDFVKFYKGDFTLPNIAYGMNMDPAPQEALIGIPRRDTNLIQNLGSESALINIGCDLDQGTWKRSTDTIDGEVFLDMLHNRSGEPWQWLDTGSHQFKVTVHPKFSWVQKGDGVGRRLDLELREYSLGSKANESYTERYGIGL